MNPIAHHSSSEKAIIFDLDGTLVDSISQLHRIFKHLTNTYGTGYCETDFYRLLGNPNHVSILSLIVQKKLKKRVLLYLLLNLSRINKQIRESIRIYPQTRECLRRLAPYHLAIATNETRSYLQNVLYRFGISGFFETTVCRSDVKRPKPAPDSLLLAAHKLGVQPFDCIVIEDSIKGIVAAQRAGMASMAVLTTISRDFFAAQVQPDHFITTLDELNIPLVEHILSSRGKRAGRRVDRGLLGNRENT